MNTVYVEKNSDGKIIRLFSSEQPDFDLTPIDEQSPDVVAFLNPPADTSYVIGKSVPWRRMTDAEAEAVDAAMQGAPLKQRRIYEAASYISTGDELFATLKGLLSAVLSPARADEILAPETPEGDA